MKFAIDCGHNCSPDIGCAGVEIEDDLTLAVGAKVMLKLKNAGHDVVSVLPTRASSVGNSLNQRCKKANNAGCDIYASIHFNCYNWKAHGTQAHYCSDAGKKIANPVLGEIVKLGFYSRGLVYSPELYVLGNTNMPAILIECCFCDSERDMQLFDADKMADAIAKGLQQSCV